MYRFLVLVVQPFPILLLLVVLGTVILWWRRKETRIRLLLPVLPLVGLTLLCLPAVGYLARGSLEWGYPPFREGPSDAGAIVVLSGSIIPPDVIRVRTELGQDTLARCLHAAGLFRRGLRLPIVVSGGKVDPEEPGPTLAAAMRDFLVESGIPSSCIWIEDRSRTTYENGLRTADMLRQRGIHKIVLVTDATHMRRAVGVFRKQGLAVIPAGCRYRATTFDCTFSDLLPGPSAAQACQEAFHEWLGILWYRWGGKM
jgi:uncharacterized SAM-binding protein YcdF (DUF218 family)